MIRTLKAEGRRGGEVESRNTIFHFPIVIFHLPFAESPLNQ
jgi:hypothetical protein